MSMTDVEVMEAVLRGEAAITKWDTGTEADDLPTGRVTIHVTEEGELWLVSWNGQVSTNKLESRLWVSLQHRTRK